jgi:hypothetical protein
VIQGSAFTDHPRVNGKVETIQKYILSDETVKWPGTGRKPSHEKKKTEFHEQSYNRILGLEGKPFGEIYPDIIKLTRLQAIDKLFFA